MTTLTTDLDPSAVPERRSRARGFATGALVVVASFAVLASSLALWSRRTLLNSERFTDQVGDVIDDSRVQDALATFLTNEVVSAIDPQAVAQRLLPDQASGLAQPLAIAIAT